MYQEAQGIRKNHQLELEMCSATENRTTRAQASEFDLDQMKNEPEQVLHDAAITSFLTLFRRQG